MIAFITGRIREKSPSGIVLEAGGIGYDISLSLSSYERTGAVGDTATLFIHLHVREDAMKLFGFADPEERALFRLLIGVSGIGPKVALGILSGLPVDVFARAVIDHDVSALQAAPGVGKKTAERLALELKDKMKHFSSGTEKGRTAVFTSREDEAVAALISLGYKENQAEAAVQKALGNGDDLSLEELIRQALRGI